MDHPESLESLVDQGLHHIQFVKTTSKIPAHYSDHAPIRSDQIFYPFNPLDSVKSDWCSHGTLGWESSIMRRFITDAEGGRYEHTSKTDIETLVRELLDDLRCVTGLHKLTRIRAGISLTKVNYMGTGGSDSWLMLTKFGRPFLVVEVHRPQSYKVLDDPRVNGQIFDCMLDTLSLYGQQHIFGVTTTMEEFRIHWFPHSDAYAAATTLSTHEPQLIADPALDLNAIADARRLHSTATMHHTDPTLIPKLISALHKGFHSPYSPVSLFDTRRAYVGLSRDAWVWSRCDAGSIGALSFRVTEAARRSSSYMIAKYFFHDTKRQVWLTIALPSYEVVVVKMLDTMEEAQRERDLWVAVNGAVGAYVTTLCNGPALCTPLVFHAQKDLDQETGSFTFPYDLAEWSKQRGAAKGPLPPRAAALSATLATMGAVLDVREVARRAVAKAAQQGVVHADLAWRHIAVMPVFDAAGVLERLDPALIDFGRVERHVDPAVALERMNRRLDEMEAEGSDCGRG